MSYFSEQFASVIRANVAAQHTVTAELNAKLVKHCEELSKLNLDIAKATLTDRTANMKEFLQANSPQDFFLLSAEHIKRDIQNIVFYGAEATRIASAVQIEFNKAVGANVAEASRNGTTLLTELNKDVPASADTFFTFLKTSMDALDVANELAKKMGDGPAPDDQSLAAAHQTSRKRTSHQTASVPH